MQTTYVDDTGHREGGLGAAGLGLLLAGGAALLYHLTGPPHLPAALPTWPTVLATLRGSDVPTEALVYLLSTAAWGLWVWIVGTGLLHALAVLAERLSRGAGWARRLRALSERVTLPVVRHLVEGAVATAIVVNVVARPLPAAAAPPPPAAAVAVAPRNGAAVVPAAAGRAEHIPEQRVRYTVQAGDSLWTIAERRYGDGAAWRRIFDANLGRRMADGRTFSRAGVIHPGWVLEIPLPSPAIEEVEGRRYYVVQEGDTLRAIAERLLGDEMRWPLIYDLNRGSARLDDGRTLTDPDLIWPGLRLLLPGDPPAAPPAPPVRAPDRDDPSLRRPAVVPETPRPRGPTPTPLPIVAAPVAAPVPRPVEPAPAATALPAAEPAPEPASDGPSPVLYAAAGALALGGAALLARRRFRRSLDEPPVPDEPKGDAVVRDGFAETDPARLLVQGAEAEPAVLLADRAVRFLAEHGLDRVSVVTLEQGRRSAELTLSAEGEQYDRLFELARPFAASFGAEGEAVATRHNDVRWRLKGFRSADLLAPSGRAPDASWLLPVGALPARETLHASWRELGHVVVAGTGGGGTEVVLTSLVASLAARRPPEQLRLLTIAARDALPDRLAALPHQLGLVIDPADREGVAAALDGVLRDLRSRAERGPAGEACPEVVLVIGELAGLEVGTALETIGVDGLEHGVRVLAATTRPDALDDATLAHFRTRLVLRTQTEEESIQLLDEPRAAELGAGGELLLRIDARGPVLARGFRVSPEHLDRLVELMREGHHAGPAPARATGDGAGAAEPAPRPPSSLVPAEGATGSAAPPPDAVELDRAVPVPGAEPVPVAAGVTDEDDASSLLPLDPLSEPEAARTDNPPDAGEFAAASDEHPSAAAAPEAGARAADGLTVGLPLPADEPSTNGHRAVPLPLAFEAAAPDDTPRRPGDAPVQVVCFGGPRVFADGREIWPAGAPQGRNKPWEVLAFLASQPADHLRRVRVFASLWPANDAATASSCLKHALNPLRELLAKHLPGLTSEVVRSGRDGYCRLDGAVVASDVHAFVALCRRIGTLSDEEAVAACREARALYRGDLLAEASYEWLEDRADGTTLRERYRDMHRKVTVKLASLCYRAGETAEAIALYEEILEAEPILEDVARNLLRCYHRLGDRSSLVHQMRRLRQALKDWYYDPDGSETDPAKGEPSPETVALYERLLGQLDGRAVAAQP